MKIIKEYNLKELENEVKAAIKNSYCSGNETVIIDIVRAEEIAELIHFLSEIESQAFNESLFEDEEHDCIGCYDDTDLECCNCEIKEYCITEKEAGENKNCFGGCVKDNYECTHCLYYEMCMLATYSNVDNKEE